MIRVVVALREIGNAPAARLGGGMTTVHRAGTASVQCAGTATVQCAGTATARNAEAATAQSAGGIGRSAISASASSSAKTNSQVCRAKALCAPSTV